MFECLKCWSFMINIDKPGFEPLTHQKKNLHGYHELSSKLPGMKKTRSLRNSAVLQGNGKHTEGKFSYAISPKNGVWSSNSSGRSVGWPKSNCFSQACDPWPSAKIHWMESVWQKTSPHLHNVSNFPREFRGWGISFSKSSCKLAAGNTGYAPISTKGPFLLAPSQTAKASISEARFTSAVWNCVGPPSRERCRRLSSPPWKPFGRWLPAAGI